MTPELPPPLLLSGDEGREEAFRAALSGARESRGLSGDRVTLFVPADSSSPADLDRSEIWIPHVYAWEKVDAIRLAWERCDRSEVESLLGASTEAVTRWAARGDELIALGKRAAAETSSRHKESGQYLSFRWVLEHEPQVARLLSEDAVAIEHVSFYVAAGREAEVARLLVEALGMVEIERPAEIEVPGRWLQAGQSRVHLNSREAYEDEVGFPGSAPNHVCFAVADLNSTEQAVRSFGISTQHSGSLGDQVWFRLPGETVIELQPMKKDCP